MTKLLTMILVVLALTGCAAPIATGPAVTQPPTPGSAHTVTPAATASRGATEVPTPTEPASVAPTPAATDGVPGQTPVPTPIAGWTRIGVDGPSAREDHSWTIDGDGETTYLFGGRTADGPSNELWAFDLAAFDLNDGAWTRLQPTGEPPAPRFGHTATWVDDVGLVVWSGQGRGSEFFDDLWVFEPAANSWRQLPSLGAVPSARYGSCASLGPDSELWISHGFTDTGRFSDTRSYEFATGTWTDRTPLGDVPVERCLHDCFWSSEAQLVLYGGQTTGVAALGDLWAYDLALGEWTPGADPEAAARQLYSLASPPDGREAFVYGGGDVDGGFLSDMWVIDPVTLEMVAVEVNPGPAPRSGATLLDDDVRARLLMFGGRNEEGLLNDFWVYGRS